MANFFEVKLDEGFKRMEKALKAGAKPSTIHKHMRLATQRNAKIGERAVRRTIRGGGFEANAALTQEIKGSAKPLVDRGELFQAITSKVISRTEAFIGVLKTDEAYNIAVVLHDGVVIPVTNKMRGLFKALWLASEGRLDPSKLGERATELFSRKPGGWKPLKASTTRIILKARPFIDRTFQDPDLKQRVLKSWHKSMQLLFRELARGK